MKTKSIWISVLNQGNIRPELANLLAQLPRQRKYDISVTYPAKKPITNNRNTIVKRFLETDYDYLLMIDGDCVPTDKILDLADYDKDIIGAVCFGYIKEMLVPFVMKKRKDGMYDVVDINQNSGVIECDGIGSGVMMIARRVLEDMPFPFRNEYDPEGIKVKGLDFNFCRRAQKMGYKVWCNTDMLVSHWTTVDLLFMWQNFDELVKMIRQEKVDNFWGFKDSGYSNSIPGWMSLVQLNWLYDTSKEMDSIVEIGSWKGKSTHALLSGCKGTVWAVDHFKGSWADEAHKEARERDIYPDFLENVGRFKNLKVLKMSSKEAAKQFKDKSVDMVFIDGGHTYEEVKQDIEMWLPKAKKLICGHDYQGGDVSQAVDEKFDKVDNINGIWVHKINDQKSTSEDKKTD